MATIQHQFKQTKVPSRKETYQQMRKIERNKWLIKSTVSILILVLAMIQIPSHQDVHSKQAGIKTESVQSYPIVVRHQVKPGETLYGITKKY